METQYLRLLYSSDGYVATAFKDALTGFFSRMNALGS